MTFAVRATAVIAVLLVLAALVLGIGPVALKAIVWAAGLIFEAIGG